MITSPPAPLLKGEGSTKFNILLNSESLKNKIFSAGADHQIINNLERLYPGFLMRT